MKSVMAMKAANPKGKMTPRGRRLQTATSGLQNKCNRDLEIPPTNNLC